MPELPEVQTVVEGLIENNLPGTVIAAAEVLNPRTVEGFTPEEFNQAVAGQRIARIYRRAKFIVLAFEGQGGVLIHLRMTGRLHFIDPASRPEPHVRLLLRLADGRILVLHDTRRFARAKVVADLEAALAYLGPEPLEPSFTVAALRRTIGKTRRQLKPLLLDQTVVAGLGNIYVDEALWEAGLHPERPADTLSDDDYKRLRNAIRVALRRGLKAKGTTLGRGLTNFYSVGGRRGDNDANLRVFRRDGLPCPRCHTTILRSVVGQRGTHFCPACQPWRGDSVAAAKRDTKPNS